ncbi:Chromosome transmission fidelity CTF7 [Carpediemonas membranifera]|uniref:Chromosome transmission fidelity CTF7 n=1 Tax=Carpediemonas membranifera TaxID=201153 RepID=A0A8J6B0N8_9EUKA|nr:Chromosome transmission fidelity CTF7 [Carpediemonas membranifera]|eukprot:KAG9393033.1 Chromosome transmission fidelity CTF7 [Carpediemonas membranifera]
MQAFLSPSKGKKANVKRTKPIAKLSTPKKAKSSKKARQTFLSPTGAITAVSPEIRQIIQGKVKHIIELKASALKLDPKFRRSFVAKGQVHTVRRTDHAASLEAVRDFVDEYLGAASTSITHEGECAFVMVRKGQVDAVLVTELLSTATTCKALGGKKVPSRPIGVDRVWVAQSCRGRGMAAALLDGAMEHLSTRLGRQLGASDFAFSQPTDDGQALQMAWGKEVVYYDGG